MGLNLLTYPSLAQPTQLPWPAKPPAQPPLPHPLAYTARATRPVRPRLQPSPAQPHATRHTPSSLRLEPLPVRARATAAPVPFSPSSRRLCFSPPPAPRLLRQRLRLHLLPRNHLRSATSRGWTPRPFFHQPSVPFDRPEPSRRALRCSRVPRPGRRESSAVREPQPKPNPRTSL